MNANSAGTERLLAYYLGSISEEERILAEDELLSSHGRLLEFIALKRSFEIEDGLAAEVSPRLKAGLAREIRSVFGPRKRFHLNVLALAGACAAVLLVVWSFSSRFPQPRVNAVDLIPPSGLSVDSAGRVPVSLDVI
jgi:hypothetical protein